MPGLRSDIDPDGLQEFSVVFTDRSLNHMSQSFQGVMNDISATLKDVYGAHSVVIVPGGGTFGMESVARQFATGQKCLVIRNGWFSFRWTQIFEMGNIPSDSVVMSASRVTDSPQSPFAPASVDEVVATIKRERPYLVFAPHVETSSGMILPDEYLQAVAGAVHEVGGMFVLDGVASGAIWIDMQALDVDVLISAPQKGWSGSPCAGLIMLSDTAYQRISSTTSTTFSGDLRKWLEIMEAYEKGGHAYHATMPTDSLRQLRDIMREVAAFGFETARERQQALGDQVRQLLERNGFPSVAAEGFKAPGVVVSYTDDPEVQNGRKFSAAGVQIAAGVPLRCGEPEGFSTFRIGLFGLDKLMDVDGTVGRLEEALQQIG